jgi:hypothetical protein
MTPNLAKSDSTIVNPDGTPWTAEFVGQRPPFQPGNKLAYRHGLSSPAVVDPIADRYILEVMADPTLAYLQQPRFQPALRNWALTQAKVELLTIWVDGMTMDVQTYSGKGQTSPLELLRKWMATAQTQAARMGLDPLSAARLGKDVAQGRQADAATVLTDLRAKHAASLDTQ